MLIDCAFERMTGERKNIRIVTNTAVVILLCFVAAVFLTPQYNTIALYVVIPFLVLVSFIRSRQIITNKYFAVLTLLYIWLCVSYCWAGDRALALVEMKKVMGCWCLCYVFTVWAREKKVVGWLYVTYIILVVSAFIYAKNNIMADIVLGQDRMGDDNLNANILAYFTFFVVWVVFILGEMVEGKVMKVILDILFICQPLIVLEISVLTASRQMLYLHLPFILILLVMRYYHKRGRLLKLLVLIAVVSAVVYLYQHYFSNLLDSKLVARLLDNGSDESRMQVLREAIRVGSEHPFTGVGAGNFVRYSSEGLFSHNTFAELWANSGIIGLVLYVYMLGMYTVRQVKRWRESREHIYLYFAILGVFYIFYQFFYVFYTNLWLIGFFILVSAHSDSIYNERQHAREDTPQEETEKKD